MTLETTTGNAFTTDKDYAKFSGKVVNVFTTTVYDPHVKAFVKRTVEYIDVGRADRVDPDDPDLMICESEVFEDVDRSLTSRALQVLKEKTNERHYKMQMMITDYLIQRGPSHVNLISMDLEIPYQTVSSHILRREGRVYLRTGNVRNAVLWGVKGIHNKG